MAVEGEIRFGVVGVGWSGGGGGIRGVGDDGGDFFGLDLLVAVH